MTRAARKKLVYAAVAFAVLVVAVIVAWGPIVRAVVFARARSAGIALDAEDVAWTGGDVRLVRVRFSLVDAPEIHGTADVVDVVLQGFSPARVTVTHPAVAIDGPIGVALVDAARFAAKHRGDLGTALTLRDGTITSDVASLSGVTMDGDATTTVLRAPALVLAGHRIAPWLVSWTSAPQTTVIGIGAAVPSAAPATITIDDATGAPIVRLEAKAIPLDEIAAIFHAGPLPKGATLDATVAAALRGPKLGDANGQLEATLHGYAPPVPREVASLVSPTTTVSAKIATTPGTDALRVADVRVVSGALALAGGGSLELRPGSVSGSIGLDGSLPCATVARSAAMTDLGSLLGGIAGEIAKRTVGGNVAVHVALDVDTRRAQAVSAIPSVRAECGL